MSDPIYTFEEGDGASICYVSDRRACTVTNVTPRIVTVQLDIATRTDRNDQSERQEYDYMPNPDGPTRTFTLRKNGRWVEQGANYWNGTSLVPGRHEYYDPSF